MTTIRNTNLLKNLLKNGVFILFQNTGFLRYGVCFVTLLKVKGNVSLKTVVWHWILCLHLYCTYIGTDVLHPALNL